jgi:hypothetical protein
MPKPLFQFCLIIDSLGNLYVPTSSFNNGTQGHIMRYSPNGQGELWSNADGFGISTGDDGVSYVARRQVSIDGRGIVKIEKDGEFAFLEGTRGQDFTWTAVSQTGELYANVWAGPNIYSIDTTSGEYSPYLEGSHVYFGSLAYGPDNQLYTTVGGWDGQPKFYVAEINNGEVVPYVELNEFAFGLTFAGNGDFFVSSPGNLDMIYKYDFSARTLSPFVGGLNLPAGLAYDRSRDILYVREQGGGDIFAFESISPVPELGTFYLFLGGLGLLFPALYLKKKTGLPSPFSSLPA